MSRLALQVASCNREWSGIAEACFILPPTIISKIRGFLQTLTAQLDWVLGGYTRVMKQTRAYDYGQDVVYSVKNRFCDVENAVAGDKVWNSFLPVSSICTSPILCTP